MLTHTDISSLPASRALDALVAEKVMGWREVKSNQGGNVYYGQPNDDWNREAWSGALGPERIAHLIEVSPYSTSIAAALEVVGKLFFLRFTLECYLPEQESVFQMGRWSAYFGKAHGYAHTAPLAICRAALKATADGH